MSNTNRIPDPDKRSIKENAINKKGVPSDGAEINHQVKDKRENHQPRDNA